MSDTTVRLGRRRKCPRRLALPGLLKLAVCTALMSACFGELQKGNAKSLDGSAERFSPDSAATDAILGDAGGAGGIRDGGTGGALTGGAGGLGGSGGSDSGVAGGPGTGGASSAGGTGGASSAGGTGGGATDGPVPAPDASPTPDVPPDTGPVDSRTPPPCTNVCTLGTTRCTSGGTEKCVVLATTCSGWGDFVACPTPQMCPAGQTICGCPTGSNACTTEGDKKCGGGGVQTCTKAGACFAWSQPDGCQAPRTCGGNAPNARCACPNPAVCTMGTRRCGPLGTQECGMAAGGCEGWLAEVPCQINDYCEDSQGLAQCIDPPAVQPGQVRPAALVSSPLEVFGGVKVGDSRTVPIKVTNMGPGRMGNAALWVSDAQGSPFTLLLNECDGLSLDRKKRNLAVADSCTATLRFAPTQVGSFRATIIFEASPGPDEVVDIRVTGDGI